MEPHTASGPWGLGDYHAFATEMVWGLGPELVAACRIAPGQRVLDVAAGTGNVALRAAAAGADVIALDITPESLAVGRAEAERLGLAIRWVEGDAQALPFAAGEFDVVASAVGAMFAPDHEAVASELLRVCRPGGTIGMLNFTPDSPLADFFGVFGEPPSPAPVLWGSEDYVRELFGDGVATLDMTRHLLIERHPGGPEGYIDFYKRTFGPVVAAYAAAADPAALDRAFLDFARSANRGEPAEYHYEYLRVIARRSG